MIAPGHDYLEESQDLGLALDYARKTEQLEGAPVFVVEELRDSGVWYVIQRTEPKSGVWYDTQGIRHEQ